ncbi:MAG: alpha/beta fold hydrolase [Gammaproteobacteria bacterium]
MNFSFQKHAYFYLSLFLIFAGGALAAFVQTNAGSIAIRDVRFTSASGAIMSGLLYVPEAVSAQQPGPGVLAVHGYINSRETQSPYAIELSRRGYVVLAMDQRGHGYSAPPAFAEGFGGPAGLQYLRSLDIVDPDQVVLAGHSMGGWTVLSAAVQMPDAYQSIVVSGSSTGTFGVPAGDSRFPRNFGLVFGQYDEFSGSMWASPTGVGIVDTEKLQTQFGVTSPVQADRLYGSIAAGTARQLYQPAQTHPANHISRSGIAAAVDWVQKTSNTPSAIEPRDQVWQWKEFGTLISLCGAILFLLTAGRMLLEIPLFADLRNKPAAAAGIRDQSWWLAALLLLAIPALTYFPLQGLAASITTSAIWAQNLTNGFVLWAVGNALISGLLLLLWHYLLGGKAKGGNRSAYGITTLGGFSARQIYLSLLFGAAVVTGLYVALAINHWLFTADFRFWVIAIKVMSPLQLRLFLSYVLPFTFFFYVFAIVLHGQMRDSNTRPEWKSAMINAGLAGGGIALLLLYQYGSLFLTGSLAIPAQALLTIVAMQFVVVLPIAGLISTRYFSTTGLILPGAIVNGCFVTWLIVAGQATHFAFIG